MWFWRRKAQEKPVKVIFKGSTPRNIPMPPGADPDLVALYSGHNNKVSSYSSLVPPPAAADEQSESALCLPQLAQEISTPKRNRLMFWRWKAQEKPVKVIFKGSTPRNIPLPPGAAPELVALYSGHRHKVSSYSSLVPPPPPTADEQPE